MKYLTLKVDFELLPNEEYKIKSMKARGDEMWFDADHICSMGALLMWGCDVTYYVNNLNMFYIYLIKFLCDNKIKFEYAYRNGKCSNVKVDYNGYKITFVNFKSKFGVDFADEDDAQNWLLIDYAIEKGRTRLSLGADAYNEFLLTIFTEKPRENANHNLIRETLPIFEYDDMLLEAKRNAYGFQFVRAGWYDKGFEYDISSSYPSSALNDLPVGLPFYFDNLQDVPKSYFKIINFTFYNLKLKDNGIPFLNVGHMGQLSLSERLFDEFKRNYDATIKIKRIEAFKTRKSIFKDFIDQTIVHGKMVEKNKRIASYNKFIGNAIIGYLGRNTTTTRNTAKIAPNGLVLEKYEETIDPIYLPAHIAILDASKARFLKAIKPYFKNIIYANTDGFICTHEIDLRWLNLTNTHECLGAFRFQNEYTQLYIECINGYAGITADGEIENTISGMSLGHTITPIEYHSKGFEYYINEPTSQGTIRHTIINLRSASC